MDKEHREREAEHEQHPEERQAPGDREDAYACDEHDTLQCE